MKVIENCTIQKFMNDKNFDEEDMSLNEKRESSPHPYHLKWWLFSYLLSILILVGINVWVGIHVILNSEINDKQPRKKFILIKNMSPTWNWSCIPFFPSGKPLL